jgi:hypothetical protein
MRRLRLTDEDVEAWRQYERANARAAEQFEALPISYWAHHPGVRRCRGCPGWTYDPNGICWACRGLEQRRAS